MLKETSTPEEAYTPLWSNVDHRIDSDVPSPEAYGPLLDRAPSFLMDRLQLRRWLTDHRLHTITTIMLGLYNQTLKFLPAARDTSLVAVRQIFESNAYHRLQDRGIYNE